MAKRILIVDDEPDVTTVLQFRLESRGFSVDSCVNGGEALDKILENEYDLVLLDYFMPLLKGDAVCQAIRCEERFAKLPLIIITSFQNYPESFFKEKGANEVIYKPFETDFLVERIGQYIGE